MKYLLLTYRNVRQWTALLVGERDKFEHACRANRERLLLSGHIHCAAQLPSVSAAITVRLQAGKLALSERSLSETEQPLTELLLIEARDLNEAIRLAAQMPQTQNGEIVVWPVSDLDEG
jgi:hypothetical protein